MSRMTAVLVATTDAHNGRVTIADHEIEGIATTDDAVGLGMSLQVAVNLELRVVLSNVVTVTAITEPLVHDLEMRNEPENVRQLGIAAIAHAQEVLKLWTGTSLEVAKSVPTAVSVHEMGAATESAVTAATENEMTVGTENEMTAATASAKLVDLVVAITVAIVHAATGLGSTTAGTPERGAHATIETLEATGIRQSEPAGSKIRIATYLEAMTREPTARRSEIGRRGKEAEQGAGVGIEIGIGAKKGIETRDVVAVGQGVEIA